ncbi:uncharacterized protein LOC119027841 [Acanthopagrus latus]|uniref:uncharacterized protein LOC119027841 n=1 Tax=Acanthopagrus latus TaxID=8177 RepID=UPI00187BFDAA|nr:uncharacterized protein LOC119027841 [Acanthopagrus latus]
MFYFHKSVCLYFHLSVTLFHTVHCMCPRIIPLALLSLISICPPHFLLSLSVSSGFPVCVYVRGLHFMYRCLHPYWCVCVSIIEKKSLLPPPALIFVSFMLFFQPIHSLLVSSQLLSFIIPPLSSLSIFSVAISHLLFSSVLVFLVIIHSFSPRHFSSLSRVPFPPTALSVDLFLRLHISLHVFLSPCSPIVSPRLFWPLSPSSSISTSLVLSPRRLLVSLSLSLSRVADLFLQLSLHFLLLFSPLSSHFYALVLSFSPLTPPPFLLFVHLLLSPPSCILPLSLIRPASIPSLWKSSPCLSLLSPPVPPSFLALLCLFISRSDSSLLFLPLFIYTRSPVSSFHNIPPSFFC